MIRRRELLRSALLAAPGLAIGARVRAAPATRRFLFLYCRGGWDTTWCFTPKPGVSGIDGGEGERAEVAGIAFLDHEERPSVRSFLETWGPRAAFLNGIEVPSIAHDRCRQILFTGHGDRRADDWPTLLAADSGLVAPHLVMSGPAYAAEHGSAIVRVGASGQLPALLSGEVFEQADVALQDPRGVSAQAAYLRERLASSDDPFAATYLAALDDAETLASTEGLDLSAESGQVLCNADPIGEAQVVLDAFELGISRCGLVEYAGWCENSWDSHSLIEMQGWHYEELFSVLVAVLSEIDDRGLADEVCVVVLSEMGREPTLNATGGKGHWTWTSAMLVGAGVAGGQVVGGVDDELIGEEVEGAQLHARDLGATLLALGDRDPEEHGRVIEALLA